MSVHSPIAAFQEVTANRVLPAGLLAAATVMGAYKMAQGFWGRIGKRKEDISKQPESDQGPSDDAANK